MLVEIYCRQHIIYFSEPILHRFLPTVQLLCFRLPRVHMKQTVLAAKKDFQNQKHIYVSSMHTFYRQGNKLHCFFCPANVEYQQYVTTYRDMWTRAGMKK